MKLNGALPATPAQIGRDIDAAAKVYAAKGGDVPLAGIPAETSPIVAETSARASDSVLAAPAPEAPPVNAGSVVDIEV